MKLYVLQHDGIVKIGITKYSVKNRLKKINSQLPIDKQFSLVCDFDVNSNAAMFERLIHEYLGINQLNVQYLKNKLILVNVDYLNSSADGYTEFFLADKDKIKQAITLFGILGHIDLNVNSLNELDNIKSYSFDNLTNKHSAFLKLCEPAIQKLNYKNNYSKSSLEHSVEQIRDNIINATFLIENNSYYLVLNENKIHISELTDPKNKKYIELLLKSKNKIITEEYGPHKLYSIIRKLREDNKETSLQPLTSMQKELKENEFFNFMNNSGYNRIKSILKEWYSEGFGANALLKEECCISKYIIENILDEENDIEDKKYINDLKKDLKILSNKEILKPNFNSPIIFPEYFQFLKNSRFINDLDDRGYNDTLSYTNMIAYFFKIIYNSKNKEEELKNLDKFVNDVNNFYMCLSNKEIYLKYNTAPLPLKVLENIVTTNIKDKNYLELAETIINIYDEDKYTQIAINKIKEKITI